MRRAVLVALAALATAAGCTTPPTGTPTGPQPPLISSFTAPGGPFPDPALVPLTWKASDANGDDLTCRLDWDGDTNWDVDIPHCQNVTGRYFEAPIGDHLAILEVTDGTATVTSTATYKVIAGPSETYDISLRVLGSLTPEVQAAFDLAESRWEAVLTRGVPDTHLTVPAGSCLAGAPAFDGTVDDLVIDVEVGPIDGPGTILGSAGPCWVGADSLSRWGVMQFDEADLAGMVADGTLVPVIMHEMGHVLGIGTLWDFGRSLLSGAGTSNPRFTGPRAVSAYGMLGGTGNVPVENNGVPGTTDSHWRESVFGNEMMTGYVSPGTNPLSAMSIVSLADMGYHVDVTQADAYSLPGFGLRSGGRQPAGEMLRPVPRRAG